MAASRTFTSSAVAGVALAVIGTAGHAAPRGPDLGVAADAETIQAWDHGVAPDGAALPAGSGSVENGEKLFEAKCQGCHGVRGAGATAEELAGGTRGLQDQPPDKTIGTYWPYATTLFDFIRRAMPLDAPGSLGVNEVYGLTAYLLHINKLLPPNTILDADRLRRLRMPNRNGFFTVGLRHGKPR